MSNRLLRGALVALPLVFTGVGISSAQQTKPAPLPRSGEFTLYYTFVNPEPWAPIPRAVDAAGTVTETATLNTSIAWLINAAGSGFGHQMTGRCTVFNRQGGAADLFQTGNCVYSDAQGDMLFEEWTRGAGVAVATSHWVGGTGKYAGVKSDFVIQGFPGLGGRTEGAPVGTAGSGPYELYPLNAGTKTGTYTLPPL